MARKAVVGQIVVIILHSQSHLDTPQSVGLLWTSDRRYAQTYVLQEYY